MAKALEAALAMATAMATAMAGVVGLALAVMTAPATALAIATAIAIAGATALAGLRAGGSAMATAKAKKKERVMMKMTLDDTAIPHDSFSKEYFSGEVRPEDLEKELSRLKDRADALAVELREAILNEDMMLAWGKANACSQICREHIATQEHGL